MSSPTSRLVRRLLSTIDAGRCFAGLAVLLVVALPGAAVADCPGYLQRTDGAVTVSTSSGGTDVDWPDVAAYPVAGATADRDQVVSVWEAWDAASSTRQVYIRLLDGCEADPTTGGESGEMLTTTAGGASHRWPRVAVTTESGGEPAVVVLYNETTDGSFGKLWAQVLRPVPQATCDGPPALDSCFCSGASCLGPYWSDGSPIAPELIGPVAIDDDRDGNWEHFDRPNCTIGTCCDAGTPGVPEPLGGGAGCDYAPVTPEFDVTAIEPRDNDTSGYFQFAVTWSQGPGRDLGQWSFFNVFKIHDNDIDRAVSPMYESGETPSIPAVRLERTPEFLWDDSQYETREASPAMAYIYGDTSVAQAADRTDALAIVWHEFVQGDPGESRLQIAVYDLAGVGSVPWLPAAQDDLVSIAAEWSSGHGGTFDCTASGWSPHPAIAATWRIIADDEEPGATLFLAWDADAYTCDYHDSEWPQAQATDVYYTMLEYWKDETGEAFLEPEEGIRREILSSGFPTFVPSRIGSVESSRIAV